MARYKIWDKQEDIDFIRAGKHRKASFTAMEFIEEIMPWAGKPGAKLVVSGEGLTGSFIAPFPQMKADYKAAGVPITEGMTDEEVLAAIEEFQKNPPGAGEPSPEERTAAAMEVMAMNSMPDAE